MEMRTVFITETDQRRLSVCIDSLLQSGSPRDHMPLRKLALALGTATLVREAKQLPDDVVSMNSIVQLHDTDTQETKIINLVYPSDSDALMGRLSVLSPIGMAILGCRVGDVVELKTPKGARHMRIDSILYQPEAAGHWNL